MKAARSIKRYLGIQEGEQASGLTLFGIPVEQHNFARLRAA